MDKAQKQEFTRRITNSNPAQLVVVIYDIFFAYAREARAYYEKGEREEFHQALRRAQEAVRQLQDGLDFSYPIAQQLYALYRFSIEQMAACFYRNDTEGLDTAEQVLKNLYVGFEKAAGQDTSEPLMKHAQQVVAGMTYGKGSALNETLQDSENSRGFFA